MPKVVRSCNAAKHYNTPYLKARQFQKRFAGLLLARAGGKVSVEDRVLNVGGGQQVGSNGVLEHVEMSFSVGSLACSP
jgi:hypothetical protein